MGPPRAFRPGRGERRWGARKNWASCRTPRRRPQDTGSGALCPSGVWGRAPRCWPSAVRRLSSVGCWHADLPRRPSERCAPAEGTAPRDLARIRGLGPVAPAGFGAEPHDVGRSRVRCVPARHMGPSPTTLAAAVSAAQASGPGGVGPRVCGVQRRCPHRSLYARRPSVRAMISSCRLRPRWVKSAL